jgi:hypothetical protein
MEESLFIEKDKPVNESLDFYRLRKAGIESIQEMSGKIWTDYNEHDPGVTMLEQLCYAITSLSFVTETPLQDLLVEKGTGKIDMRRQALFIPKEIFTCNAWTADDYRKLVLDQLVDIGNVWFIPREVEKDHVRVRGLYDVLLYLPLTADAEKLKTEVRRIYASHRNLCEDLHEVHILKKNQVSLYADIAFNDDASPESILARVFFSVSQYMSPEIKRYSLEEMQTRSLTSGDLLFEGPLMQNGFILDDDLQPMPDALYLNQIEKIILGLKGVENIRHVSLRNQQSEFASKIDIPKDSIFVLNTLSSADKSFTIRFFKKGVEYKPNPATVWKELEKLRQGFRYRYKLDDQYEEFFGVPKGQYKPVEDYYSIQNQFPNVYGINKFGLLQSETPERKSQAKQLKGYLLLFEQLMADFLSQLSHIKDLFSCDPGVTRTYFYQRLEKSVPNVKPLLKKEKEEAEEESLFDYLTCLGYNKGLEQLIESMDPFLDRRNRFLDYLLALYAVKITPYAISSLCRRNSTPEENVLHAKLQFLKHLPESTHDRGKGFDYLNFRSHENISGMELKIKILLGMKVHQHHHLSEEFKQLGFNLADPSDKKLRVHFTETQTAETFIAEHYHIFGPEDKEKVPEQGPSYLKQIPMVGEGIISGELLEYGAVTEYYRVGTSPLSKRAEVVFRHSPSVPWRTLGEFSDEREASSALSEFVAIVEKLQCSSQRVYIIEHSLLRYALKHDGYSFNLLDDDCTEKENGEYYFDFDFHITAVFSGCHDTVGDAAYRSLAEEIVRENTPAHIVATCVWITPWRMILFEFLYAAWRLELTAPKKNRALLAELSKDIILFLKDCSAHKKPTDKNAEI